MQYILSKRFEKEFAKLPKGVRRKAIATLELFVQDHEHSSLRTHTLAGKWRGHWSIVVTGDYHAVFVYVDETVVLFVAVGIHSQIYS